MLDLEWHDPSVKVDWTQDDKFFAYYIEGWQYEGSMDHGDHGTASAGSENFRHGILTNDSSVDRWLHQEGRFEPLQPPDDWPPCTGGFRLLIFDRTHFFPLTLTVDEASALEAIDEFHLVPETIPIMTTAEGALRYRFQRQGQKQAKSLQLLIQSNQILKVANFMISLSYDFEAKRTTAIACVENEHPEDPVARRLNYVIGATKWNPGLWAHPTFLPTIFARHYSDEMRESRAILRGDISDINRRLGVSTARSFHPEGLPDDWPEKLDFRWLITNTYARRVEVMQVREGCKWSCRSLQFLCDLEKEISAEGILNADLSHNVQKLLEYHLSVIEGTEGRYATLQEESEASTNMLFNAITQRDSIIAQRYNDIQKKIATSTKEDSISMSTFTFITALFLPGTFISALLSLTMIDWQPQSTTTTAVGGSGSSSSSNQNTGTQISRYYWVFWAIDIPLTVFVMFGWYVWFRHAKKTWIRENGIMLNPKDDKSSGRSSKPRSSYDSSRSSRRSRSRSRSMDSMERRSRRGSKGSRESRIMDLGSDDTRSNRTLSIRREPIGRRRREESPGSGPDDNRRFGGIRRRETFESEFTVDSRLSRRSGRRKRSVDQGRRDYEIELDRFSEKQEEKEGDVESPKLPAKPLAAGLRDRWMKKRAESLRERERDEDVEKGSGSAGKSARSL